MCIAKKEEKKRPLQRATTIVCKSITLVALRNAKQYEELLRVREYCGGSDASESNRGILEMVTQITAHSERHMGKLWTASC